MAGPPCLLRSWRTGEHYWSVASPARRVLNMLFSCRVLFLFLALPAGLRGNQGWTIGAFSSQVSNLHFWGSPDCIMQFFSFSFLFFLIFTEASADSRNAPSRNSPPLYQRGKLYIPRTLPGNPRHPSLRQVISLSLYVSSPSLVSQELRPLMS